MPQITNPNDIKLFLETGEVSDGLLHAYDQTGKKIPAYLMPTWEPNGWLGIDDAGYALRPLHDRLPEEVPIERTIDPKNPTHLRSSFFTPGEEHIPYEQIDGNLLHLGKEPVFARFLKRVNGSLVIPYTETVTLEKLTHVGGDLNLQSAVQANIPHIKNVGGSIDAAMVIHLFAPELTAAQEILADTSETIHLPNLKNTGRIVGTACQQANIGKIPRNNENVELPTDCFVEKPKRA